MGISQYWTRKGDKDDRDKDTVSPWAERVGHGDVCFPDPHSEDDAAGH